MFLIIEFCYMPSRLLRALPALSMQVGGPGPANFMITSFSNCDLNLKSFISPSPSFIRINLFNWQPTTSFPPPAPVRSAMFYNLVFDFFPLFYSLFTLPFSATSGRRPSSPKRFVTASPSNSFIYCYLVNGKLGNWNPTS